MGWRAAVGRRLRGPVPAPVPDDPPAPLVAAPRPGRRDVPCDDCLPLFEREQRTRYLLADLEEFQRHRLEQLEADRRDALDEVKRLRDQYERKNP